MTINSKPALNPEAYKYTGASDQVIRWITDGVPFPFVSEPQQCARINSFRQEVSVNGEIEKLLSTGAIREVTERPHCILVISCVPKKNKKLRLVIDCRPINQQMETPAFTQEDIKSVVDLIQGEDQLITVQ